MSSTASSTADTSDEGSGESADGAATSEGTTTLEPTTTESSLTQSTDSDETSDGSDPSDPYGPCIGSQDCSDPSAVCVSNGNNSMCAPLCTTQSAPSSECPRDLDNDMTGVACLFTDAEQTILRCFTICDVLADCPLGMTCEAPVCTWASD